MQSKPYMIDLYDPTSHNCAYFICESFILSSLLLVYSDDICKIKKETIKTNEDRIALCKITVIYSAFMVFTDLSFQIHQTPLLL